MSGPKLLPLLTAPLRLALFDPRATGLLLATLLCQPSASRLRSILPAALHPYLSSPSLIRALSALLSLGIVRSLNARFSRYVSNNWKADAQFVKSQELVLITGGASGIGELMAKEFAHGGVKVLVLDLREPKVAFPPGIHFYRCNVTEPSEIRSVAEEIRKTHGDPTVLVNNAGIGTGHSILDGTEARIRLTFEVNTIAHFWMVREFIPAMIKKNHGHVVTIASMASYLVHAQNVDYACSKASALAFHEGLASELRSRYNAPNVRTTVVNPAWIRTPLIEKLTSNPRFQDPVLEADVVSGKIVAQIMKGRSGQLILPEALEPASSIRGWPAWLQGALRNRLADSLKDESFTGLQ
ncbi:hypothetical protein PZA11_004781 [Diplocarpon coronariae]